MCGRALIVTGTRWRIGSGDSVDARTEHWMPRSSGFTVREPNLIPVGMKVADLKLPGGDWNILLLQEVLVEEVVEEVMKIPCISPSATDEMCWNFTKDGEYTVKSGYRVACDALGRLFSFISSSDG